MISKSSNGHSPLPGGTLDYERWKCPSCKAGFWLEEDRDRHYATCERKPQPVVVGWVDEDNPL